MKTIVRAILAIAIVLPCFAQVPRPPKRIYELSCPSGSHDLESPTLNPTTGKYRSWLCMDSVGNVSMLGATPNAAPTGPTVQRKDVSYTVAAGDLTYGEIEVPVTWTTPFVGTYTPTFSAEIVTYGGVAPTIGGTTFVYGPDAGGVLPSWTGNSTDDFSAGNPSPSYALSSSGAYFYRNVGSFANTTILIDVQPVNFGTPAIVFGAASNGSGPCLIINNTGGNSGIGTNSGWTESTPSVTGASATWPGFTSALWYTVKIVIGTATATWYINGTQQGTAATVSLNGTYFGVTAAGYQGGGLPIFRFDNISVTANVSTAPSLANVAAAGMVQVTGAGFRAAIDQSALGRANSSFFSIGDQLIVHAIGIQ